MNILFNILWWEWKERGEDKLELTNLLQWFYNYTHFYYNIDVYICTYIYIWVEVVRYKFHMSNVTFHTVTTQRHYKFCVFFLHHHCQLTILGAFNSWIRNEVMRAKDQLPPSLYTFKYVPIVTYKKEKIKYKL